MGKHNRERNIFVACPVLYRMDGGMDGMEEEWRMKEGDHYSSKTSSKELICIKGQN